MAKKKFRVTLEIDLETDVDDIEQPGGKLQASDAAKLIEEVIRTSDIAWDAAIAWRRPRMHVTKRVTKSIDILQCFLCKGSKVVTVVDSVVTVADSATLNTVDRPCPQCNGIGELGMSFQET
jgi:hypothetical protein